MQTLNVIVRLGALPTLCANKNVLRSVDPLGIGKLALYEPPALYAGENPFKQYPPLGIKSWW